MSEINGDLALMIGFLFLLYVVFIGALFYINAPKGLFSLDNPSVTQKRKLPSPVPTHKVKKPKKAHHKASTKPKIRHLGGR